MTDIRIKCSRRSHNTSDFKTPSSSLFICASGLNKHWNIEGAKKLEIRLHDGEPTKNAHAFRSVGDYHTGIYIEAEQDEDWSSEYHGIYSSFAHKLQEFAEESGSRRGWMELSILG